MQSLLEQVALLVFKALRGMAPMYLQDLLQAKTPGRQSLRSDVQGLFFIDGFIEIIKSQPKAELHNYVQTNIKKGLYTI